MESFPLLGQQDGSGRANRRALLHAAAAAAGIATLVCVLSLVSSTHSVVALAGEEEPTNVQVDGDVVSIRNPETGVTTVSSYQS
jgi:hypothetical protein